MVTLVPANENFDARGQVPFRLTQMPGCLEECNFPSSQATCEMHVDHLHRSETIHAQERPHEVRQQETVVHHAPSRAPFPRRGTTVGENNVAKGYWYKHPLEKYARLIPGNKRLMSGDLVGRSTPAYTT